MLLPLDHTKIYMFNYQKGEDDMNCMMISLIFLLLSGSVADSFFGARETLQALTKDITRRRSACYTRFDNDTMLVMQGQGPFAEEMRQVYSNNKHMRKACVQQSEQDPYHYNPFLNAATEDLNYATRVLKLIRKYAAVVIMDEDLPGAIFETLFGQAALLRVTRGQVNLDTLTAECEQEINGRPFAVVVTALKGISPILHHRLMQKERVIVCIDMDDLLQVLKAESDCGIDLERFNRLMARNIHIMATAAVLNMKFEQRRDQYLHSVEVLNNYGIEPYIVESCVTGPTYLDECCAQVLYTQTNDATLTNKGINEARAIIAFFDTWGDRFNPDDIIIKMTGRYYLADDRFIRQVEDEAEYDAFAMNGFQAGATTPYLDLYTGMFALKYRYFTHMIRSINFAHMNEFRIWFEWEVSDYLYGLCERHVPVRYVDSLGLYHYILRDGLSDIENNVLDDKRLV